MPHSLGLLSWSLVTFAPSSSLKANIEASTVVVIHQLFSLQRWGAHRRDQHLGRPGRGPWVVCRAVACHYGLLDTQAAAVRRDTCTTHHAPPARAAGCSVRTGTFTIRKAGQRSPAVADREIASRDERTVGNSKSIDQTSATESEVFYSKATRPPLAIVPRRRPHCPLPPVDPSQHSTGSGSLTGRGNLHCLDALHPLEQIVSVRPPSPGISSEPWKSRQSTVDIRQSTVNTRPDIGRSITP